MYAIRSYYADRILNINKTAQVILDTNDPPIRMLWVACKNPFSQDFDRNKMVKAFDKLEIRITSYNVCYTKLLRFNTV